MMECLLGIEEGNKEQKRLTHYLKLKECCVLLLRKVKIISKLSGVIRTVKEHETEKVLSSYLF